MVAFGSTRKKCVEINDGIPVQKPDSALTRVETLMTLLLPLYYLV